MKKSLTLLLCTIMCLSFVSCAANPSTKETLFNSPATVETEADKPTNKVLTFEELTSAVTIVDLTVDNWENYFEITEIEEITPADFEDEEPEIEKDLYVKLKTKNTLAINTVMRFSFSEARTHYTYDSTTKEMLSSSPGNYSAKEDTLDAEAISYPGSIGTLGKSGTNTYHKYEHQGVIYESILDVINIECLKVTGKILLLDIPDDAWNTTRFGENMPYILYEKDGVEYTITKDGIANAFKDIFFP